MPQQGDFPATTQGRIPTINLALNDDGAIVGADCTVEIFGATSRELLGTARVRWLPTDPVQLQQVQALATQCLSDVRGQLGLDTYTPPAPPP